MAAEPSRSTYKTSNRVESESRGRRKTRVQPGEVKKKGRTPSPNTRIDPKSLPLLTGPNIPPSNVFEYPSNVFTSKIPPRCRANCNYIDEGCASPRFTRLTQHLIPATTTIANNTSVSLGLLCRPLAEVGPQEQPVQLTEIPGLPRCENCYAYVNAHCTFPNSGHSWRCSLCQTMNAVPDGYYCGTDGKGGRTDRDIRPELCMGSVDIIAPPKLQNNFKKPNFLFVIDTSKLSHSNGFLTAAINGIFEGVETAFPQGTTEPASVGVITYDSVVKIVTPDGVYVMNDIDSPFLPVPYTDILVPVEDEIRLNSLLEKLDTEFLKPTFVPTKKDPGKANCCFGAAIALAEEILSTTGGRVVANIVHLPNAGVGALKNRDDRNIYGTKKEKTLLQPQGAWYRNLVDRCTEKAIAFDLFFGGSNYCDVLTISELSHFSGGSIFHYPNFNYAKDAEAFSGDLSTAMIRNYGIDAYIVVRHSPGVILHDCYGGFSVLNQDQQELRFATINSDSTFLINFEHEENLNTDRNFVVQIAMLYTPRDTQQKLIRLHTICRKINSKTADVFRSIDLETVMTVSAKMCVETMLNVFSENHIHSSLEQIIAGCTNVLSKYRKHCAKGSHRGQLILPDTLKLMPLYTLGLIKNPALSSSKTIDERVAILRWLGTCPMSETLTFMYPNMYRLDNMDVESLCYHSEEGYFQYPTWTYLSRNNLAQYGLYLMNTSTRLYLCIDPQISSEIFESLFYQESGEILLNDLEEGEYATLLACVRGLIDEIRFTSSRYSGLQILWKPDRNSANIDESQFFSHLIDDAPSCEPGESSKKARKTNPFRMDYTDFLVFCHTQVRKMNPR